MGIDIHVHLFGTGDSGSGCRLSREKSKGLLFRFLARKLGLRGRAKTLDESYVLALAEQIRDSGLTKAVVLAQDAVYDERGEADWRRTHFYVPNDYLFDVVARYPESMIPCVSINPQRADAIDELNRCAAKGARVLKIHPPTQGVDLAERRHARFFRHCAELKMVVMVHTGHEHSACRECEARQSSKTGACAGRGLHGGRLPLRHGVVVGSARHASRFFADASQARESVGRHGGPWQCGAECATFCGCWPTTGLCTGCCTAAIFRFRRCR